MAMVFSSPEKTEQSNFAMGPGRFLIQGMKKLMLKQDFTTQDYRNNYWTIPIRR